MNSFYNNFPDNSTFQNITRFPPPPMPPPFFLPPLPVRVLSDQEFIKQFEKELPKNVSLRPKPVSINKIKNQLHTLLLTLNNLKAKEKALAENINVISDDEWKSTITEIERNKGEINQLLSNINDLQMNSLRKLLSKRTAKRLRLKRQREERKKEKAERFKELKERSRKIDENLQKIKDDIEKAKQEEESKLQADVVLKEVRRKKHDAKKYLAKLDALLKLRRARQNTAKGRGDNVSERDAESFNTNIEKLKSLWRQKLSSYEQEETDLRAKLSERDEGLSVNQQEQSIADNLAEWRDLLFGDKKSLPQVDFNGDVNRFVSVRSQWDRFISCEGSPMPIGWVVPSVKSPADP